DVFETRVARVGQTARDVTVMVAPDHRGEDSADREVIAFRWQLTDVTERNRAEAARDQLLARLVTAQEDERRRVSRELHDSFGPLLTALPGGVGAVRNPGQLPREAAARLEGVEKVVAELHRAAHDLAVRLRPTALDDVGLAAALRELATAWSRQT